MAFIDAIALPSGVFGPDDFAPFRRADWSLRKEDKGKGVRESGSQGVGNSQMKGQAYRADKAAQASAPGSRESGRRGLVCSGTFSFLWKCRKERVWRPVPTPTFYLP